MDTVPYDPEESEGGVTPAVWNGGDDFTVQQTLSWGEAWDWATGGRDAFTFEDNGDYNWDCGWVLHYLCVAGGGLAQGGAEVWEDAKGAACHVHICSHDSFKETWSGTWDGVVELWNDPVGSVGAMWDDFWDTPQRNDENLSGDDSAVKNTGYWLTQIPGTVLKPFRLLGNNGRSSDQGGNDRDRDGIDCSNSFVPGTLVVLADGTVKPIELVQVGDEVLAADPETGEQGPREVTHLIAGGGGKTLVDVSVDDGSGDIASVTATDQHPFWVPDQGWTAAIDLEPGSWLQTSAGVWVQVTAVDAYTVVEQDVHNLTVADLHTYYVASNDARILVSNSNDCPDFDSESNGLTDQAYTRIEDQYGNNVATGVDYQLQRMNDELNEKGYFADHDITGRGMADVDAIASYLHSWEGAMTHVEVGKPGTTVAYDRSRGVMIVQNSYQIHAYKVSEEFFNSGRYEPM